MYPSWRIAQPVARSSHGCVQRQWYTPAWPTRNVTTVTLGTPVRFAAAMSTLRCNAGAAMECRPRS
jgi:hypothetical protein